MNRYCLRVVLLCLLTESLCFGEGFYPSDKKNAESFSVIKKPDENGNESIGVKLKNEQTVWIGRRSRTSNEPTLYFGDNPETVRVYRLSGSPDLLLIYWHSHMHGNGIYEEAYYEIRVADNPEKLLLKGFVGVSGHWGWGTSRSGSYRVEYNDSSLSLFIQKSRCDNSEEKEPLYFRNGSDDRSDVYMGIIETELIQTFEVVDTEIILKKTVLEYTVQGNESLDEICEGLNLKREWILDADSFDEKTSSVKAELPVSVAVKRYPLVDRSEP